MKKILSFAIPLFVAIIALFSCSTKAEAWSDVTTQLSASNRITHFIRSVTKNGNYIHIEGYAYRQGYQNFTIDNHTTYITIRNNNTGTMKDFRAANTNQPEDLNTIMSINGYPTCGNLESITDYHPCGRLANGVGFSVDIPLSEFELDVSYTFYIRLHEHWTGAQIQTQIISPNAYMPQFEWNHNTYQVDSTLNSTRFFMDTAGVKIRRDAGKWAGQYNGGDWPLTANGNTPYWGFQRWYTHIRELRSTGAGGVWVRAAFAAGEVAWGPYGRWQQVTADGEQAEGWLSFEYCIFQGTPMTLKVTRKSYIGNIQLETKTAKLGDQATIKANIQNQLNSGENPAKVRILVDNKEVYNSGVQNWSGVKTFSVDIPATSNNRTAKVEITETVNNKVTTLQTTLYAASNQTSSVSAVSGTVKGNNPIYVIKTRTNETKYYETFTYNQGQLYYALDDSNILSKTATVNYSTDYSNIKTWDKSDISASSYISSPQETYAMDVTNRTDTSVTVAKDKAVTYTNLDKKSTTTIVSGLGVNNITLKMNANYQFIDASEITLIDTRTHDKGAPGEIYVTINNQKMRHVKYRILYDGNVIEEGEDTWNGDKNFKLDPIIDDAGKIRVEIIQPNTIPENLTGEIYVATEDEINIMQDGTYTPDTPIRVVKTPSTLERYYETITVDSKNESPTVNSGACFENNVQVNYSTTKDTIGLDNSIITSQSFFPQKDEGLHYAKQDDGTFLVQQEESSGGNYSTTLPEYVVDRTSGTVYEKGKEPEDADVIDGGRCWYVPMDAQEGKYDYETYLENVGVNKVKIHIDNNYTVDGSLLGNTDSVYKVIRVKNPSSPDFSWHKSYSMSELLAKFDKE